jgi:ABC-type multidrug transport system ATPase subunit
MKQRIKLAQAFFSDTKILLLDEPCTNLDQAGIDLYKRLIDTLCQDRLVLISSNDPTEYASCSGEIRMGV